MKRWRDGRACGMHGRKQKYKQNFGGETWRKTTIWKIYMQMGGGV